MRLTIGAADRELSNPGKAVSGPMEVAARTWGFEETFSGRGCGSKGREYHGGGK